MSGPCASCGTDTPYRLSIGGPGLPWCCGTFTCEVKLRDGKDISRPVDRSDASLDRLTAHECFEYLSRGLEGGEVAILKAIAMTRAHERRGRAR